MVCVPACVPPIVSSVRSALPEARQWWVLQHARAATQQFLRAFRRRYPLDPRHTRRLLVRCAGRLCGAGSSVAVSRAALEGR